MSIPSAVHVDVAKDLIPYMIVRITPMPVL